MIYTWVVKFFNQSKNYWFITPNDGGKDLFFHGSKMRDVVANDDVVTYDIADWKKWPEAVNIMLLPEDEEEVD